MRHLRALFQGEHLKLQALSSLKQYSFNATTLLAADLPVCRGHAVGKVGCFLSLPRNHAMLFFRCKGPAATGPHRRLPVLLWPWSATRGREMAATGPGREPMLHGPGALAFNLRVPSIFTTVHESFFEVELQAMSFPNGLVPVSLPWQLREYESAALGLAIRGGSRFIRLHFTSLLSPWTGARAAKPLVFRKDIDPSKALFLFLHFAVALPQKGGRQRRVGVTFASAPSCRVWNRTVYAFGLLERCQECIDALTIWPGAHVGGTFSEERVEAGFLLVLAARRPCSNAPRAPEASPQ